MRAAIVLLTSVTTAWAFHRLTVLYRIIPLAPEAPELEAVEVLLVTADHVYVDALPFLFVTVHSPADFVYADRTDAFFTLRIPAVKEVGGVLLAPKLKIIAVGTAHLHCIVAFIVHQRH